MSVGVGGRLLLHTSSHGPAGDRRSCAYCRLTCARAARPPGYLGDLPSDRRHRRLLPPVRYGHRSQCGRREGERAGTERNPCPPSAPAAGKSVVCPYAVGAETGMAAFSQTVKDPQRVYEVRWIPDSQPRLRGVITRRTPLRRTGKTSNPTGRDSPRCTERGGLPIIGSVRRVCGGSIRRVFVNMLAGSFQLAFRTPHSRRTAARVLVRMFAATLRSRWQRIDRTSSHNLGSTKPAHRCSATMHEGGWPEAQEINARASTDAARSGRRPDDDPRWPTCAEPRRPWRAQPQPTTP